MAQIPTSRLREMESIAARDPSIRFSIIVTLKEGASPDSVADPGFQMQYSGFNIVSGSASPDAIRRLSARNDVELVEEDGEVHALGGSA